MAYLPVVNVPSGAPSCWGMKYQDGDIECGQCRHNDTCKKEVLREAMNAPFPARPVFQHPQNQPQPIVPFPRPPGVAPLTLPTPYKPASPTVPMHPIAQYQHNQPVPVSVPQGYQQQPTYQQFNQHYYTPNLPQEIPDPMTPWVRPGSAAPPYYFTQYPGESMAERLTKNIVMAIGAAIAAQLVSLFTQWTWPPRKGNNNQD